MELVRLLVLALSLTVSLFASAADDLARREWMVDGLLREGLIAIPPKATTDATPVVFAFHGHGGSAQNAARQFHLHTLWPEALVVYLQGLNTPGKLTDPEGKKPGWQHGPGAEGDRDLKFFDTVLASLRKDFRVDDHRIFSTGHSNGGGFTYLLWAMRGDQFAAFAPSAAAAPTLLMQLKPKPVLHVAGETDPLVKFEWQQQTIDAVRKINQCGEGQPGEKGITTYPSKIGAPVVTLIHPGGHQFVPEEPTVIVRFFKEQVKP
jgi:polyhydroxybutyrate depolymerase